MKKCKCKNNSGVSVCNNCGLSIDNLQLSNIDILLYDLGFKESNTSNEYIYDGIYQSFKVVISKEDLLLHFYIVTIGNYQSLGIKTIFQIKEFISSLDISTKLFDLINRKYPIQKRVNTINNSLNSHINYKSHLNNDELDDYYWSLKLHKEKLDYFERKGIKFTLMSFFDTRRRDNSLARFKMSHPA